MKVPISWLKEYVAFEATPEELAKRLTFSGVEVEGIHRLGEGLDGLVVGEIRRVEKHPGADKLVLCVVYDGVTELPVVCGASNFKAGDKAAFAPVGAALPGGMRIEKRRVRGMESHGMLCAEDELGLSSDHSGILLVDGEVAAGTPLLAALGLPDVVLELEITWNRPDCLSIIGMAREVAALFGASLQLPDVGYAEAGPDVAGLARVAVSAPERCARYTARVLQGMQLGPSPDWMQRRLKRCGVRPISNIVDVTNYVMLECGQPLHAFDHTRLADQSVVVRCASAGESMHTLDGIERRLTPEMLLITDARRPVALAGVMGGAGSEILDTTRDVLLESASFDAPGTHRTSVALGLATESSHRFERGVDPELADWASRRAVGLMLQTAGGVAARGVIDVYPGKAQPRRVTCRFARCQALLGIDVGADEICRIFTSLGLAVEGRDVGACTVRVPSFRRDIEIEADLIEEVARMHGLEQVPDAVPHGTVSMGVDDSRPWARQRCREKLAALGLREILNYSFMAEKSLDRVGGDDPARRVILPNPVSSDHGVLRPALLPQLLLTLGHNMSRQVADAGFFEMGRVFTQSGDGSLQEAEHLALGLMGKAGRSGLDGHRAVTSEDMFLWLKGVLETLCRAQMGAMLELAPSAHGVMEPGWCFTLTAGGQVLGTAGLVRRDLRDEWRISEPVGVAEMVLEPLLEQADRPRSFAAVPVYPAISHDVALIVAEDVRHESIVSVIRAAGPSELTQVNLFDIYRGEAVGAERKSLAYSLVYQSGERTLTDEEANQYDERIRQALKRTLGAEIREG
ncbi:MAG: phenylalanine--tRNA ligase subunit beta [Lentisphaerae bacterium]|nr:phenylalanine--tRNA ligase subunit beta [Lentisphaerota bacterium]